MVTYGSVLGFYERPTETPHSSLLYDPSSLCLFFAVLYCGARSLHPSQWLTAPFDDLEKDSLLERLNGMYHSCLKACRCSVYPTLNSLTALVLGESCSKPEPEPLANMGQISMMSRVAQFLGLHSETDENSFSNVEAESRHRVWWHILSLDFQCMITTGASTCINNGDAIQDLRIYRDLHDGKPDHTSENSASALPSIDLKSLPVILSAGRCESIRISQCLIAYIQGPNYLLPKNIGKMIFQTEMFNQKIKLLLVCIPSKGLPEKGFISTRVKNATPTAQPILYSDAAVEPSVFGSWVRIMLSLFKLDAAIILQKQFLGDLGKGSEQESRIWSKYVYNKLRPILRGIYAAI